MTKKERTKLDKISDILETLLDDALEADLKKRFYKISDKDLLAAINVLAQYFEPKQQNTNTKDATQAPTDLKFD